MRVNVRVYRRYRKHVGFPEYQSQSENRFRTFLDVPVFIVSEQRLDDIAQLSHDDWIREHNQEPLLIFTDRHRVLAVAPEGYDYARYACVIDTDTVRDILFRV